jgi:hypothetical protein
MPKEYNASQASRRLRTLAAGQCVIGFFLVVCWILFFLFLALNCLIKLSVGYGWTTIGFLGLAGVVTIIYISLKRAQLSVESCIIRQRLIRKPQGFRENLWRVFMPGNWMREIAVDAPRAEIQMSDLSDLERPLPVSTRARY